MSKKCKRCGACQECGQVPYVVYPQVPYTPWAPYSPIYVGDYPGNTTNPAWPTTTFTWNTTGVNYA